MLLALGLVTGHIITNGPEAFTFLYDHYTGLITASLAMSVAPLAGEDRPGHLCLCAQLRRHRGQAALARRELGRLLVRRALSAAATTVLSPDDD
jgi:hypothetical protein